ncbi:cytochrome c3 family protein [Bradyrhizobium sp.]|uniref:cytochrome c3 family protein n=1 Tax=Bradyrhizobium sp. TaxID=376 RepID=UPI00391CDA71
MRFAPLYVGLIAAGVFAATVVGIPLYRSGSTVTPNFAAAVQPLPLSAKHEFIGGKCEACHTPLRGIEASSCISCHATAAGDLGKQSTAFHASAQQCRDCHSEHKGASRLIAMDHSALLKIAAQSPATQPRYFSISREMVDDLKGVLGIPPSQPEQRAGLDCANCHSNRDPHRELFGRDCASCHHTVSWQITGYVHPSVTSRDCAQCHQAPPSHYMEHFVMMDRMITGQEHAQVDQCYLCHRTDSFNDIKNIGWLKHH